MQGVGVLHFTIALSTIGYPTLLFRTLTCFMPPNYLQRVVCAAVGELLTITLGNTWQRVIAAISFRTTMACMGTSKFAISNAEAEQDSCATSPVRKSLQQHQKIESFALDCATYPPLVQCMKNIVIKG